MKKSRKLELSTIIAAGANCDQVDLFRKFFGESVMVTEERAASVADKFNWSWTANNLLSAPAEKRYLVDTAPAFERFHADIVAARERFNADIASLDQFKIEIATTKKLYYTTLAATWARAYINDGGE